MYNTPTSGLRGTGAPIPLSFSIPSTPSGGAVSFPDGYTAQFQMNPPLILPDNCCCDLIQASFAYSQPNVARAGQLLSITNGNNRISINYAEGGWLDYFIPTGLYDYLDVAYALNVIARAQNGTADAPYNVNWNVTGSADLFTLNGISSTQKIVLTMNPAAFTSGTFPVASPTGFAISFTNPSPMPGRGSFNDSMGDLLGFGTASGEIDTPSGGNQPAVFDGENVAGFSNTSAYVLYMSIITNSYKDGSTGQLLYSFPLGNSTPNSVVAYQSTIRFPVPIAAGTYSTVRIWTTDQSGNRLPWALYQSPFQFTCIISKNKADGSI
jgi:hypothetical protein